MPTWLIIVLLVVLFGSARFAAEVLWFGLVVFLLLALCGAVSAPIAGGTVLIIVVILILLA